MAAGVKELQDQIDIVNTNTAKLEKSLDGLVARNVALQTQVQTDAATIAQLQAQLAAAGSPDLQPQVDELVTHNGDIVTMTTVADGA